MNPRVALIGVGGYGRVHLRHLLDFHARGELILAAAVVLPCDAAACPELLDELRAIGCACHASLPELLAAAATLQPPLDLAIVPTPIHLHADMTVALLAAGLHVLVEKPLTASPADADRIAAASAATGRRVAVGFQYLHAPEVRALRDHLQADAIGPLERIAIHGSWPRSHTYYRRNEWAGRLTVDGLPVLDSPVNNAMSHFVMLALHLGAPAGSDTLTPNRITAELYRVQSIESFDTAVIKARADRGPTLEIYCTHSGETLTPPRLLITGRNGTAEWVQDRFASTLRADGSTWQQPAHPESFTRETMLRNVLADLADRPAFVCRPAFASAHVRLVDALHRHVPITAVPAALTRQRTDGDDHYTYLPGLDSTLAAAADAGAHLHRLNAAWAVLPTRFSLTT